MRNSGKRAKKPAGFGWLVFWLAFLIGVSLLFVINREKVQAGLAVLQDVLNKPLGQDDASQDGIPREQGGEGETVEPPAASLQEETPRPVETPPPEAPARPEAAPPQPEIAERIVKRPVYMIRLDQDGKLAAAKVERELPSGESPMQDALEAAIRGPSAAEAKRDMLSLIPGNVKILGAVVRGGTAYINFSEDFLFNTYGIEGYAGQVRQVVWTATEFGNVKDVQILVEGKRVDYLGEGIWIGSPISRDSL